MRFLVLSALIATTLVACGPTKEEKENRRVRNQNNMAHTLNARVPTVGWTDAQLDQYEKELREFEVVDRGLNRLAIAQRRERIQAVRAFNAMQASIGKPAQAAAPSVDHQKKLAQEVLQAYDSSVTAFEKEYVNNPDTTVTDVPAALKALDHVLELNAEVQKLSILTADEKAQFAEARKSLEAMRDQIGKPMDDKSTEDKKAE